MYGSLAARFRIPLSFTFFQHHLAVETRYCPLLEKMDKHLA